MRITPFYLLCGFFFLMLSLKAQVVPQASISAKGYQAFSEALRHSELGETLANGGTFTIFAPSDKAFQKLDEQLNQKQPGYQRQLNSLISYHIVAGELTASQILKALCRGKGAAILTTIQGEELIATLEGVDIVLMDCSGNTSRIVAADASTENFVMHEIDRVVFPGTPIP